MLCIAISVIKVEYSPKEGKIQFFDLVIFNFAISFTLPIHFFYTIQTLNPSS